METIANITKKVAVLCTVDDPTPIMFFNLYDEGDMWVKIKGCKDCPQESRKLCCGQCPLSIEVGCVFHLERDGRFSKKPFHCVIKPYPSDCLPHCHLEYKCIEGNKKGKVRRVKDRGNIFQNEE